MKVTTDTNNHNSRKTKHILRNNFNICYHFGLKPNEILGIGMPGTIMINYTKYINKSYCPWLLLYHCFIWENWTRYATFSDH